MKKSVKKGLILLVSLALVLTAAGLYEPPTSPMTVNPNVILAAAHSQGYVTPEVLGLNNYTARQAEIPDRFTSVEEAAAKPILGVFGSDINASPNPFLYNYFYNCYAQENRLPLADMYTLSKGIGGMGPAQADLEIVAEYGTSTSLYLRPDILIGDNGNKGYTQLIAALPENAGGANAYNPYQISYLTASTYNFLDTLFEVAEACEKIEAATGKTGRYGNVMTIAVNIEKYVKGLQCYVLEQLAKERKNKKVVAIIDGINSKGGVFLAHDENTSTSSTTTECRAAAFVADTTTNFLTVLGRTDIVTGETTDPEWNVQGVAGTFYVVTAEEILRNADYIITSGVQTGADVNENAFREMLLTYIDPRDTALVEKAEKIPLLCQRFSTVGTIGVNSVENLLGMAYWTAWCYPEYLNPIHVATYWYENFYHVTDANSLQTAISTNFAGASVPEGFGFTTDLSGYNPTTVANQILSGMMWYEANSASLANTMLYTQGGTGARGWNINWDRGIGAGQRPAAGASGITQSAQTGAAGSSSQGSGGNVWIWVLLALVVVAVVVIVIVRRKKQ